MSSAVRGCFIAKAVATSTTIHIRHLSTAITPAAYRLFRHAQEKTKQHFLNQSKELQQIKQRLQLLQKDQFLVMKQQDHLLRYHLQTENRLLFLQRMLRRPVLETPLPDDDRNFPNFYKK